MPSKWIFISWPNPFKAVLLPALLGRQAWAACEGQHARPQVETLGCNVVHTWKGFAENPPKRPRPITLEPCSKRRKLYNLFSFDVDLNFWSIFAGFKISVNFCFINNQSEFLYKKNLSYLHFLANVEARKTTKGSKKLKMFLYLSGFFTFTDNVKIVVPLWIPL